MKKVKVFSKITDYALNALIVLFALFLLASIYSFIQVKILKNDHSSLFGYSLFEIQTGSMHGSVEIGDWILVKSDNNIKIGDIITYKQDNNFITHRVVEAYQDSFVTKGDANNAKDKPIDRSQIVGKVKKVLHSFGFLKKTIFNPIVIIFLIITLYFVNLYLNAGKKSSNKILNKYIGIIKNKIRSFKHRNDTIKVTNVTNTTSSEENKFKPDYSDVFASDDDEDDEPEDEMSKTILFRKVTVDGESGNVVEFNEDNKIKEEDLSKTAVLRIIKVDDIEEPNSDTSIKPVEDDQKVDVKIKQDDIVLEAEEIEEEKEEKVITKDYLREKINAKKAKNIVDKLFIIKNIMYNEIIDLLLDDEYSYIKKSSFRSELIKQYVYLKYYSLPEERKSFKMIFNDNKKALIKKNQNDDTKTKAIELYSNALLFIYDIEDKKNIDFEKELHKYFDVDNDLLLNNIKAVIRYSSEIINEIIKKFETNSFIAIYNRFKDEPNYFGVYLNYNIKFSKVYSKYIVDKTYSDGIVSEDKLSVLFNLILCRVVKDILNGNSNAKYFVYIPNPLYGKDKKLDRIASIIDNEYAKNHIIITSTVSNILQNNDDIMRLRKKGYLFALIFDEYKEYTSEELAYIFMSDYYFTDKKMDLSKLSKNIPKQIYDKIIIDNILKRIGEYK